MKKKISLLLLAVLFLFSSQTVLAEDYLIVDRDEQSSGVETTHYTEDGSWDLFYDSASNKYNVVYNITSEAPDEITLDLTNSLKVLVQMADGSLETNEDVKEAISNGEDFVKIKLNKMEFTVDLKSMKSTIYVEPGDRIAFRITVKNTSGKSYVYKEDSLVIATPKQKESNSEVIGFDGQEIEEKFISNKLRYGYNENLDDHNIANELIDRAIKASHPEGTRKSLNSNVIFNDYVDYLVKNYNGDDEAALVDLFNKKYQTVYSKFDDFSKEDFYKLSSEISATYTQSVGYFEKGNSLLYDTYYNVDLSAIITTEEDYNEYEKTNRGEWSTRDGSKIVGKYMYEKVNGIDNGGYKKAESFVNDTIGELKNDDSASFIFGLNIEGQTNNNYQNFKFSLYSSIKMVAKKGVVIINYVDENGKTLKESETVEYYYYEDYETKAAAIDGYELIEINGTEKGSIETDETVVTYVYQYVLGEGGEEEKEEPTNLVQTGSEVDYSLMTSALITISLMAIALKTKKKNN